MSFLNLHKYIYSGVQLARASFKNEVKTILKDKGALLILLIAVFTYPLAYSIAYMNNVVRDIPVTIVDLDNTSTSRQMIRMLGAAKEISVAQKTGSLREAKQLFWDEKSKGIILIPEGFERELLKGFQTSVSVYCDAGYFLVYKETLTGALQSVGTLSAGIEIKRMMASGMSEKQAMQQRDPMPSVFYNLYNPAGSYGSYVMPGLILIILQQTLLIGIGMIGGAWKERRSKRQISPGVKVKQGMFSVVLGKAFAYFILYLANLAFTLGYLARFFGFPNKGSFADVCILLIPYLFSVIFLGLTISTIFRRREHSIMTMVFISPIVLFVSGLSWPSSSIPPLLYKLAHVFPSTSMIPAFLRIRTMGVSIDAVRPELLFLTGQMIVYFIVAAVSYKKAEDLSLKTEHQR